MTAMTAPAAAAFALIAALAWLAVYRQWARVERAAKPLVMVALAALALTMGAADHTAGRLVLMALFFSLVGDIFLNRKATVDSLGVPLAFLLAHLAYVFAFLLLGFQRWWALLGLVIAVPLGLTSGRRIVRSAARVDGVARGAGVTAYLLVISAMVITASGTGRLLVLLGALTFMISDTVLGLDRFVGPRANARMVVLVTCHLGQAMMVIGALR